jgi:hypothetical protein
MGNRALVSARPLPQLKLQSCRPIAVETYNHPFR